MLLVATLVVSSAALAQSQPHPQVVHDQSGTLAPNASVAQIDALLQSGRWMATVPDKRMATWESMTFTFGRDGKATTVVINAGPTTTTVRPYRSAQTPSGPAVTIGNDAYTIRPCTRPAGTTCLDGPTPPL